MRMTNNQIKYGELLETIQHNRNTEGIQTGTLIESKRHNMADEGIRMFTAKSNDYIGRGNLAVNQGQLEVSGFEAQTHRMDAGTRQGELAVHQEQTEIQHSKLNVDALQADTQRMRANEDIRHNQKTESQGDFRNVVDAVGTAGHVLNDVTRSFNNVVNSVPGFKRVIGGSN